MERNYGKLGEINSQGDPPVSFWLYQALSTSSFCRLLFMPFESKLPTRIFERCFSFTVSIVGFIYFFLIIVMSSFALLDDYLLTIHDIQSHSRQADATALQVVITVIGYCFTVNVLDSHCLAEGEELGSE